MERVPHTLCGLDGPPAEYASARCVIIPVPYEGTVTYGGGASGGPTAIIDASRNMETFDEELLAETVDIGIHTFPEPLLPTDPAAAVDAVESLVADVLGDGKFPIVLGGEHSVSLGPVRALAKRNRGMTVLQIDAHADLRDSYRDSKYSHACIGARIKEVCPLVQVGIRSLSAEEYPVTQSADVTTFFAKDWEGKKVPTLLEALSEKVYITIDLDGLDPSVIPGTGTPEPGGLLWNDVLLLLREVAENRTVVGFDVVELAPIPGSVVSEFAAAKLTYRLLGYVARSHGWLE
jgi:agmatinase